MATVNQDQVVTQTPDKEISAEEEEASLSRPQLRVVSALHFRITSANPSFYYRAQDLYKAGEGADATDSRGSSPLHQVGLYPVITWERIMLCNGVRLPKAVAEMCPMQNLDLLEQKRNPLSIFFGRHSVYLNVRQDGIADELRREGRWNKITIIHLFSARSSKETMILYYRECQVSTEQEYVPSSKAWKTSGRCGRT